MKTELSYFAAHAPEPPHWFKRNDRYENKVREHPTKVGYLTDTETLVRESEMEYLTRWRWTYAHAMVESKSKPTTF